MSKKLYNAICFFPPKENKDPLKYRNVSHLENFTRFITGKGILYFNLYRAETKEFDRRIWINR